MKVVLVYFDIVQWGSQGWAYIGIGSIRSYLDRKGYETQLFHILSHDELASLPEAILAAKPDLVGFTATSHMFGYVRDTSTRIRETSAVPIVCGGVHATHLPVDALSVPAVDYVCVGEGEEAIVELCQALASGGRTDNIANIWTRGKDGAPVGNPCRPLLADLDALPFPDRTGFRSIEVSGHANVMGSRGCPFDCPYCCNASNKKLYQGGGRYIRLRSVENLLQELEQIKANYAEVTFFDFQDEIFGTRPSWLEEFAEKYPARVGLPFSCMLRPAPQMAPRLELLKKAGCASIQFGIESGNETFRKNVLKRQVNQQDIVDSFVICRAVGIRPVSLNMVGLPGETFRMMLDTVDVNRFAGPHNAQLSVFTPYPGTEFYRLCVEQGVLQGGYHDSYFDNETAIKYPKRLYTRIQFIRHHWDALIHVFATVNSLVFGKQLARALKAVLASPLFPISWLDAALSHPKVRKLCSLPARLLERPNRARAD